MSEAEERPSSGIKRLERRRGRIWGFLRRERPGVVSSLSPLQIAGRLRHLMMSSVKTAGSYVRRRMGEDGLREMMEHQATEFALNVRRRSWGADQLAGSLIKLNFQPLGMDAEYEGDSKAATILVKSCPLPQRFLQSPELLVGFFESDMGDFKGLQSLGESLTAKGEWPPKTMETCFLCRVVMPRVGDEVGFEWERGVTDDKPPRCFFKIKVGHNKRGST